MLDYAEPVTRLIDELKTAARASAINRPSGSHSISSRRASTAETDRLVGRDPRGEGSDHLLLGLQQSDRRRSLSLLYGNDARPFDHLRRRGAIQPRRDRKDT
jgi:hypothetical protein